MEKTLIGVIRHQSEIYIVAEKHGYVSLTAEPDHEDEQCVRMHVSNIDAVIALLYAAKREALEAQE